jgi:serine/threonine protein kinase
MQTKTSEFLAKGTYGCVFYPSINACSGQIEDDIDSDHYITKIQRNIGQMSDEIVIGNFLQTIPLYDHYFAPIVKSCNIQTRQMDYNLVKTCSEMQNDFGEFKQEIAYMSNKIRYVGKNSISKHIHSLTRTTPQNLYRKLINTHLHILDALKILGRENIIHFDLKPQNIMYDDIQDIPIIIDFGLSRDITPIVSSTFDPMKNEKMLHKIFMSDDTYDYWCIDIYILSNIGTSSFLKLHEKVTEGQLKTLLRGFITPILLTILSDKEIKQFKNQLMRYFSHYIKQQKTWLDVFYDLMRNYNEWDNYSLAITYSYTYLKTTSQMQSVQNLDINTQPLEIMQQYSSILKNIVMAMPDNRPTPEDTIQAIKKIVETRTSKNYAIKTSLLDIQMESDIEPNHGAHYLV